MAAIRRESAPVRIELASIGSDKNFVDLLISGAHCISGSADVDAGRVASWIHPRAAISQTSTERCAIPTN
jgi:hypothetical protein